MQSKTLSINIKYFGSSIYFYWDNSDHEKIQITNTHLGYQNTEFFSWNRFRFDSQDFNWYVLGVKFFRITLLRKWLLKQANDLRIKWSSDQMIKWSNDQKIKRSNDQTIIGSNNQMIKQSNDQTIKQSNDQMIKWWIDKMIKRWNDQMIKWLIRCSY